MLREAIQAARQALDEAYAAADDEELTSDVREQIFTILNEAESAFDNALRLLEQ